MLRSKSERTVQGLNKSNEEKLKVVVCTPQEQHPPVLTSFLNLVKEQTKYIYTPTAKFSEVFDAVTNDVGAAIVICIATKEELPDVIQLLANLKSRIDSGTHKFIVYNQVNNDKATGLLRSKGVSEVVEQNVSLKALQYKFNNIVHLVEVAVKRIKADVKNGKPGEKNVVGSSGNKNKKAGQVIFSPPIEHFSDFWLLMDQKNARFVIGKWFVNFYGPGPSAGSWELYTEKINDEQGWIWNPRKEDDRTFYQDAGRWVFFGNCPEFSWEEKHWYFISKKPEFAFYVDKKALHKKIQLLENGDLQFCENSRIGKNLQGVIQESIDASIHLKDSYRVGKSKDSIANDTEKNSVDFRQKKEIEEIKPDYKDKKAKESEALEYRGQKPKEKEYAGRFSEQFEERKKKYTESYDCTELSLGLLSVNGKKSGTKINIEAIELREKYLVLDVPADLLKVDDLIELEAIIKENGIEKKVTVGAATQIVETESEDHDPARKKELRSVAICELNDVIGPQFVELIKAFKDKRDQMTDFFSKAKGVA